MWFFGFLVFLGNVVSQISPNIESATSEGVTFLQIADDFVQKYPAISAAAIAGLIFFAVVVYLLRLIGTASLIKMSNNILVYGQMKPRTIFLETKKYAWKLFLLELMIGLWLLIMAILLFSPAIYLYFLNAKVLIGIFTVLAALLFVPLLVAAYYVRKYAQIYLVLGEMSLMMAIDSAYDLLEKNLKHSLIMGIFSFSLYFISMFVCFLIVLLAVLAIVPLGFLLYIGLANVGMYLAIGLGSLIVALLIATFFSAYEAFIQSLWVLFFQQIALDKKKDKEDERIKIEGSLPSPEAI